MTEEQKRIALGTHAAMQKRDAERRAQAVHHGVATGAKEAAVEKLTGGLGRFYGKGLIGMRSKTAA